jgi:hypothetical protein
MSNTSKETPIRNPLLEYDTKIENLERVHNLKEQTIVDNVEKKVNLTAEEKFNLMKEIEIKTENKMKELYEMGQLIPPLPIALGTVEITPEVGQQQMDILEQTMQIGADEFKQKMGRNMTYSEMRMMFG